MAYLKFEACRSLCGQVSGYLDQLKLLGDEFSCDELKGLFKSYFIIHGSDQFVLKVLEFVELNADQSDIAKIRQIRQSEINKNNQIQGGLGVI